MHDIHTHIGQFNEMFFDYKKVFSALKENGVTETTLAYLTPKFDQQNFAVEFYHAVVEELKEAEKYAEEISLKTNILYWADPLVMDSIPLETVFEDFKYSGICLHPILHDWTKSGSDILDLIFNFAEKQKLPVFIHTGVSECDEPLQFEKWFSDFPKVKVHLAHCKNSEPIIYLFSKYKNLYGDTAFCPEDSYKAICDAGFKPRMLFGTDFPISHYWKHRNEKNPDCGLRNLTKEYKETFFQNCFNHM